MILLTYWLIDSLLQECQKGMQSINNIKFVFDSTDLLYYHLHRISLKIGKSYIKSPEWLENKRATINPKNDDNNCFQYITTLKKRSAKDIKYYSV